MKVTGLALATVLTLAGCSTFGGNEELLKTLQNLEHCDRQYTVAVGMGAAGSLNIVCKAKPFAQ